MAVSLDELINIKDSDNLIFHYTNTETALTKILSQKQLRLNSFKNMNDPMEFQDQQQSFGWSFDISRQEISKKSREIDIASKYRKERVKAVCFSIDKLDNKQIPSAYLHHKGWARSRMWTQYANKHKGLCLIFEKDKILKSIQNEIKRKHFKNNILFSQNIIYSNDVINYKEAFEVNISENNIKEDLTQYFIRGKEDFLFKKLEDYRDEQEFRIIIINKNMRFIERDFLFSIQDSIAGIIIGCNFEKAFIVNINEYSKDLGIKSFILNWEYGAPKLDKCFG